MKLFVDGMQASDSIYNAIRDSDYPTDMDAKRFCEELWKVYKPYADLDFISGFQKDFQARFWEMYLACTMLKAGFKLYPHKAESKSKQKLGRPDICLLFETGKVWIEAIAITSGNNSDRVPDYPKRKGVNIPEREILLRYTYAVHEKMKKYEQYTTKGIVAESEAYIIAINASQVRYSQFEFEFPRILKAVLGIGEEVLTYNTDTYEHTSFFRPRPYIEKQSGEKIRTNIFLNNEHTKLSGIINSHSNCYSHYLSGDDFIFIHNSFSTNPIPHGSFQLGREYTCNSQGKENYEIQLINDWRKSN